MSTGLQAMLLMIAWGGYRGIKPHYKVHRAWRREQAAQRRALYATLKGLGYDMAPLDVAMKTGVLLADTEWNVVNCQLQQQLAEDHAQGARR